MARGEDRGACLINDRLGDDELRAVLSRVGEEKDKDAFALVCKRWLYIQSTERTRLCARAGPHMLRRLAGRFTRLRELDFSQSVSRAYYPGVSDDDLSVIAEAFSLLKVLTLQNCKGITDKGLEAIGSGLPHLQSLDVSYCRKLTDKGLTSVAKGCHDLRALHLEGCRLITDSLLKTLSANCSHLEDLDLEGCTNITNSGLAVLVEGCKRIKHLNLNKCNKTGDIGVTDISKACSSSLLTLKLLDCYKVGDDSISSLARYCNNLETLIIGGCRNISDESIKSLAISCCKSLKKLRMDWCLNISDPSLLYIFSLCQKLEVLDIACCELVTDAAFEGLGNEHVKLSLKTLRLSNCPKITARGIKKLLKSCEYLEYVDVRSCPHLTPVRCLEDGLHFPRDCMVNFAGSLTDPDIFR